MASRASARLADQGHIDVAVVHPVSLTDREAVVEDGPGRTGRPAIMPARTRRSRTEKALWTRPNLPKVPISWEVSCRSRWQDSHYFGRQP
jgi:hypothetical protein